MWNATKIKREQRRLDEMVTSVGLDAQGARDRAGVGQPHDRWERRSHHETPIAAMAEFALLGESAPKGGEPLEDVFGGNWDD